MANIARYFDAKVTVRSQAKLLSNIKSKLLRNPDRMRLFSATVFGPWLDIPKQGNDNHLVNFVLQHQGKMYILLLGTTALSLVTTPVLFRLMPAVMHLGVLLHWFPADTAPQHEEKSSTIEVYSKMVEQRDRVL